MFTSFVVPQSRQLSDMSAYVLHAFQKKSKTGIRTPVAEMSIIRQRLEVAEGQHEERIKEAEKPRTDLDPRRQKWGAHFAWAGPVLVGKTPTGRATISVLKVNQPV
jgi:hypothetical protein